MMILIEFLRALDNKLNDLEINIQTENGFYYIPFEKKNKISRIFEAEIVEFFTIEEWEVEGKIVKILYIQTKAGKILK